MDKSTLSGYGDKMAASEEDCICNFKTFACIAVFPVKNLNFWGLESNAFAHEFGHMLGMDTHDDDFYHPSADNKLLMWTRVYPKANIWSPKAREAIRNHDHSCLLH